MESEKYIGVKGELLAEPLVQGKLEPIAGWQNHDFHVTQTERTSALMLKNSLYARIVTGAAGLTLLMQSIPVSAAPQVVKQVSLGTDVALEDGNLIGKVLTSNGKPVDGAVVTLHKDGKEVGKTVTKADGSYTIGGLTTGSYTLITAEGPVAVRL